jgi:hypothetical protein
MHAEQLILAVPFLPTVAPTQHRILIMSEARCPLGFTGTPPAGHPTMAGMKSVTSNSWTSNLASYRPSTLLIVDAVFLGVCIIAAVYRDDLKALFAKSPSSPATSK